MVVSLIFFSSLFVIFFVCKLNKTNNSLIVFIAFLYHQIFIILYYYYFLESGSDAMDFYFPLASSKDGVEFEVGGLFVVYIASFFIHSLDMTFYEASLLFGCFGFFGILVTYLTIIESIYFITHPPLLARICLFLPGLGFWTSSIGKDSLIFLFLSLVFFSISGFSKGKRKKLFFFSILVVFLIRPQIAIIIIFSLLLAIFFGSSFKMYKKYFLIFVLLLISYSSLPFVMNYVGLSELDTNSVESYISTRQGYNQSGTSSFDLANSGFISRNFTYLFRPLFFDASSLFHLVISFENLFYLYLFIFLFNFKYLNYLRTASFLELFSIVYISIMTLVLASITANIGIAIRQKTMFMVLFVFLFIVYKNKLIK